MIKDQNSVSVSGKIFWSKLDEKKDFSMLRLGVDIGEGRYNRVFVTISNPHEKSYQFVKNDNQVMLIGAWLDTWKKSETDLELQLKAYDSNVQFYTPEKVIPHLNEVILYGKVDSFKDGEAIMDCIGGRNPKTGEYTHRTVPVTLGDDYGDITKKKVMLRGTLGTEEIDEKKSKLKVFVEYDKVNLLG
jgi:hypothetical protein